MASNIPIVRQVTWFSLIPQFLFIGIIILVYDQLGFKDPFLSSALTYLIISFGLRNFVAQNHRRGMNLVKQQQFEMAIPQFVLSVAFFTKNNWIDKYRFLTLLSSSRKSYKEMGLCNIAFCYGQTGNGQKAKEYYELTLKEFLESGMAITGLKMINSFEQLNQTENSNK
jgi:hypothetical protein